MTDACSHVAAAMLACYPRPIDFRNERPEMLEARQSQWGICLGALAEALARSGALPPTLRSEFYRAAGLKLYD